MSDPIAMTAGDLPPAAPAQARIWHLERRRPGRLDNTIAIRWLLEGEVAADAVESALRAVIQRHEILRTRLVARAGVPVQDIRDRAEFKLNHVNIRALPIDDHEERIAAIAREMAAEPFDLTAPPPMRVTLVRTTPQMASLLIAVHRCAFDAPSVDVLGHEIGLLTAAAMTGQAADLPELPLHFGDYALLQEECAGRPDRAAERTFWADTLAGTRHFDVSGDVGRGGGAPGRVSLPLPPGFARRLGAAARARGVSPFAMGAAAVGAALGRLDPGPEVVLCARTTGRDAPDLEHLIGPFVNPIPLRLPYEPAATLAGHLDRLSPRIRDALAHSSCPLAEVMQAAPPAPAPEGQNAQEVPYSSVAFAMDRACMSERDYGPFRLIPEPAHRPGLLHPLSIDILGRQAGWEIRIDHDRGRYSEARIAALGHAVRAAFERLLEAPDTRLADLPGLEAPAPAERSAPAARAIAEDARPAAALAPDRSEAQGAWEMRTLRPGAPDGPVFVTVNRPALYRHLASCLAPDRTIVNIAARGSATSDMQADIGPEPDLAEAADLVARAFPGRPLALAGHGPDAVRSMDLASKLEARGVTILCCALSEAWPPPEAEPSASARLWRRLPLIGGAWRTAASSLRRGTGSRLAWHMLRSFGAAPAGPDAERRCASEDRPPAWDGEVLVFASGDAGTEALRVDVAWSGLLAPDTAVFHVPGQRDHVLLGPGHRRIAEILDRRIARRLKDLTEWA